MYKRITSDIYILQGYYSLGWEDLATYDNLKEAKEDFKAYLQNENTLFRIIKRRLKNE